MKEAIDEWVAPDYTPFEAAREHRSVANMVEMLIRRHCDQSGIAIPEQSELFQGTADG